MHDPYPIVITLVFLAWAAVSMMLILRYLKQPTPVAYIITGLLLGPFVLGFVTDRTLLELLGELGLILLLFFVGTEVSLSRFARNWRLVLGGTVLQVLFSLIVMGVLGAMLGWPIARTVLLAFVISLSSTAVVLKYLEERKLLSSKIGSEVTGILIMQDLLLIPMLLVVNWMGGTNEGVTWPLQILGIALFAGVVFFALRRPSLTPSWIRSLRDDHELQLFAALLVCFGFALIAELFMLSYGLGALVAGILVSHVGGVDWVREQLHAFHTFFLALFFISIGMLIDLGYFAEHMFFIIGVVLLTLVMNTLINAVVFRLHGESWQYGIFAGTMLAQIGELSFLLAATGLTAGTITREGYQVAVLVISLSLLLSPIWIILIGRPGRIFRVAK